MKCKFFAALALVGLVGVAHADEPESTVSKCMKLHQYNSIAQMRNNAENVKKAEEYLQMSFTTKQIEAYRKQISEWNNDPTIRTTYKGLLGPDFYGRSLPPAIMMAACIKAM